MAKQNALTFEGRVLTDVKTKQFTDKSVSEWLMGLYAGKDSQGQYKKASIQVKYWGHHPPQKGQDIILIGKLNGEAWSKDGKDYNKPIILCESFSVVGQQPIAPPPQESGDPASSDDLPF